MEGTDRLAYFGEEAFEYDEIGNPIKFRNMTATWSRGRQLQSLSDGTNTVNYVYDGAGMRRTKTVGGVTTTYTHGEDGKLRREAVGDTVIDYIYGASGVVGLKINDKQYLFRKNIMGDVTHIYDESGALVGKYSYTAFGEVTVDVNVDGVAELNPIRYRGYYYDSETGLYFLKTRYYDPEIGRFMTIDDISYLDPETINGLNLYAYCGNNPVMFTDPNGTTKWWEWLLAVTLIALCVVGAVFTGGTSLMGAAFIGAALMGGVSLVTQAVTTGSLNWGQFLIDMGVGALTGALGASGVGKLGGMLGSALIGGVGNVGTQLVSGKSFQEIDWLEVVEAMAISGIFGFIAGAGARNVSMLKSNAVPLISIKVGEGVLLKLIQTQTIETAFFWSFVSMLVSPIKEAFEKILGE